MLVLNDNILQIHTTIFGLTRWHSIQGIRLEINRSRVKTLVTSTLGNDSGQVIHTLGRPYCTSTNFKTRKVISWYWVGKSSV